MIRMILSALVVTVLSSPVTGQSAAGAEDSPNNQPLLELTKNAATCPREICLTTNVTFPLVIAGREAGRVQSPSGTRVQFAGLAGQQVKIVHQGKTHIIPISSTDLLTRLKSMDETIKKKAAMSQTDTARGGESGQPRMDAQKPGSRPAQPIDNAAPAGQPSANALAWRKLSGEADTGSGWTAAFPIFADGKMLLTDREYNRLSQAISGKRLESPEERASLISDIIKILGAEKAKELDITISDRSGQKRYKLE